MAPTPHDGTQDDDDPTRALDGFAQRMRQPPAGPPPDLTLDLGDIAASLRAADTPRPARGGVLRSGERWSADDVEDVPVIEVPRPAPPTTDMPALDLPEVVDLPPPAADLLDASTRSVRDAAAAQLADDAQAATAPVWQPDPVALQLRPAAHPRVLAQWQPGAWTAAWREVLPGRTEFVSTPAGPVVEHHPPRRLLLLWPPRADAGPPGRWPQQACLLGAPTRSGDGQAAGADAQAAETALALLPDDATLWLRRDGPDIDWALGAELVLHHTPTLPSFQVDGLRAFIADERQAVFLRVNDAYHQPMAGGPVVAR